jgi:hypothetical protein
LFCYSNTVNLLGAVNAFPTFDHIEKHPFGVPMKGIAIPAAAAVMSSNFLPRLDDKRCDIW